MADLEGAQGARDHSFRPKFTIYNVSKTQHLKPKIHDLFAMMGVPPPPFRSAHPLFKISGSATETQAVLISKLYCPITLKTFGGVDFHFVGVGIFF
jgi:hypothetical protein